MTSGTFKSDDGALLDTEAAAALLCLKPSTLAWYRCHGGGPAYLKVGSNIRYSVEALNSYVREVQPRPARGPRNTGRIGGRADV